MVLRHHRQQTEVFQQAQAARQYTETAAVSQKGLRGNLVKRMDQAAVQVLVFHQVQHKTVQPVQPDMG